MTDIAIRAEKLSKQYCIGGKQEEYKTLRDTLARAFTEPLRLLSSVAKRRPTATAKETIWALKDVSFEVKRGEVVGIIGQNGAGKSTLLKILSRITEPTEGYAEVHGRVGSLLEVGTGFHPELTGRENIYLNGAILGMKKTEIERKFDEIVAFAEIEKFVDTPVKRYSSGMHMRLAFSVAAHLEPDILLVDEVLAVGDYRFQQKCLRKMSEVSHEGRTILFVSHNMSAVKRLCENTVLLQSGQVRFKGSSGDCIRIYLESDETDNPTEIDTRSLRRPPGLGKSLCFLQVRLRSTNGCNMRVGESLELELEFRSFEPISDLVLGLGFNTLDGIRVFDCRSTDVYPPIKELASGRYGVRISLDSNLLMPGDYTISVGAGSDTTGRALDLIENVIKFRILPLKTGGTPCLEPKRGFFRIHSQWTEPTVRP
jgi:lipopolysaccharide transport system ATP-binding protein